MNTENQLATTIPQPKAKALAVMAERFNVEPARLMDTLKNTVFNNANEAQLMALVIVSNEYGLNPFTKQIYAFPDKGGGIVPVVSVDGWAHLGNSHPQMDGIEFEDHHDKDGKLVSTTAIIYRKDRSRPVKVTEYLSECRRNTEPWKMEHRMLRHKALIQGYRVAFSLSGIHDEDDAEVIAARPITGRVIEPRVAEPPRRAKAIADTPTEPVPPSEDAPATPEAVEEFADRKNAEVTAAKAKSKDPAPKATPLQGIQNLCKASAVKEGDLLEYLKSQGVCDDDAATLENVAVTTLEKVISDWEIVLAGMVHAEPIPDDKAIEPTAKSILAARVRFDLDEKQVVAWAKAKHWCDAKAKWLSELNPSALTKIAANLEASKDEISAL